MDRLISGAKEKVEIEEQLSQCLLLDVKGKSRGKRLCGGCWKEVQWLVGRKVAGKLVAGWLTSWCWAGWLLDVGFGAGIFRWFQYRRWRDMSEGGW
ncbi:hypothetical protein NC653_029352 [Populus alba x Populus x berolinensis]|uniref:Transmembrane protein n=1 Tax=Populus alba x Populus x berolinensis TaxID=444605 RepID=A0AAD6M2X7_9ROSI|nr:hypothetical protein NC653_029352 [Populus alba x Populus x berolinensis]